MAAGLLPRVRQPAGGVARIAGQIAFAGPPPATRGARCVGLGGPSAVTPREPRAYLALAVAGRVVCADAVLGTLHKRGRGI